MRFETIRYLDWARRKFDEAPPAYNLAVSGLERATMQEAGIDPARLQIAGNNAFGHPGLRRRLGELYGVAPEEVLIAAGTSGANFLIQAALVREGDTVLCEWPAYEPLWRTLESLGTRIQWIQRTPERGYAPDVAAIAEGFARGARLLMLTDLHNPSATILSRDMVREIGRLALRHDAWVIIDEVYLSSVFDRPVESGVRLGERIIITSSLTKTYGLGGLRAGWAVAPVPIVEKGNAILGHLVGNAPFIADEASAQALEHLPQLAARAEERRSQNWPLVRSFARERRLLECEPAGAFIVWLKLPKGLDSDTFVDHLSTKYETLVVPGAFFGMNDHIRVGFGLRTETIKEGLRRLGLALDDLAS
jgi:aspartate/methionine/tyrosine aminotransferase